MAGVPALVAGMLATVVTGCGAISQLTAPPTPLRPLGAPALGPPGDGGYAFLAIHPDGSPMAWDPCREIHVVVRPDNEPAGGRELLLSVLSELHTATGLVFVDDGATTEPPDLRRETAQPERYGSGWAPVLVTWSTSTEVPDLTDDILGFASPVPAGSGAGARFVTGQAVFHAALIDAQLSSGQNAKVRAVLLHELGHLIGLGHVNDLYQVMYDTNSYPLAAYHAGDLRGLELLGRGRCFRGGP